MRQLAVYWWQGETRVRVGRLGERPRLPVIFEWDRSFLLNQIELSPISFRKTPDVIECPQEPFDGLPGLFADCVPDGWGKILLRIGLAKKGITATDISPLDALAYIGDGGMGALSFEPEMRAPGKWAEGKLSLADLEKGIQPILDGSPSAVIEAFLQDGASPNGMRPKIILKEKDGHFYSSASPVQGNEWLIKFRAPSDPPGIGKLEFIYSRMAEEAGLEIPETRLFKSKGKEYFGVRRFDRTKEGRVHVHTLSAMLSAHPANFSVSYEHFATAAQRITGDFREIEKVFRLAAFNVLATNQDDHSKNAAFLMDRHGSWKVAPAYDLTFHKTRYSEHKMSLAGKGKPMDKDLLSFGIEYGLSKTACREIIDQTTEALSKFKRLARDHELPGPITKAVSDAIAEKLGRKK